MRLWSIHPQYLDTKGLVALWREALLAQNVLHGNTKGYKNHPQLLRFKGISNPEGGIATYLRYVAEEADKRGYNFDRKKIKNRRLNKKIPVTNGQVEYEVKHLLRKLENRDLELFINLKKIKTINVHPLFKRIKGDIEDWEIT